MRLPRPACSFGDARAFSCVWGHAISARMSKKTLYRVSIRQVDKEGRITWHGVLTTDDHEKANETMAMLKGDPEVRVKLEAIVPGRGYEEIIPPGRGDL